MHNNHLTPHRLFSFHFGVFFFGFFQRLRLQFFGSAVELDEHTPAHQQTGRCHQQGSRIQLLLRFFLRFKTGNQPFYGQGHHQHHQETRQESADATGATDVNIADDFFFQNGL